MVTLYFFGVEVLSFLYFFECATLMEKDTDLPYALGIAAASCNDNKH